MHLLLPAAEIDKDGNGCVDFQEFLQVSSAAALTAAPKPSDVAPDSHKLCRHAPDCHRLHMPGHFHVQL